MAIQDVSSEQIHAEYSPDSIPFISNVNIQAEYSPDTIQYISSVLIMVEYVSREFDTRRTWQIV